MQKGQFILLGVTIARDVSIALLKEKSTGKTHRVKKGKEVNGITLEKVEAEKVTLTQSDESEELTLKIQDHAKTGFRPDPGTTRRTAAGQPQPAAGSATAAEIEAARRKSVEDRQRAMRNLAPAQ